MSSYKDIYIRKNPLKNIECNPLYTDTYKPYFKTIETFENPSKCKVKGNNKLMEQLPGDDMNLDNFGYLEEDMKLDLNCKNDNMNKMDCLKKVYKSNIKNLKRRKKGESDKIDKIHNSIIKGGINYKFSEELAINKISNRLNCNLNNHVVNVNNNSYLDDPFFSHPANSKYEWKNSYFKNTDNGKWVYFNDNDAKPLDYKTLIDYRTKKPAKVDYNIIEYKNF